METNFYQEYYNRCRSYSEQINECMNGMDTLDECAEVKSELLPIDYSMAMLLGVIGAFITSSKNVEKFLNEIHEIASTPAKGSDDIYKKIVKFLLGHNGDYIDSVPVKEGDKVVRRFVTRQAEEAGDAYIMTSARSGPHRIFWGHDILSFGKDNPFVIMQKQMPGLKGIVQTIKHLTADTFSKQGLPIPTSSWWDYTYTDKRGVERTGNKLLDYCNKVYEMSTSKDKINVTGANNDIFNHMFSIHIQDIGTQKLGSVLCDRYLSYKKISNEATKHQFKLIFAAVLFYMNSIIGMVKYAIPYINWAAALMMIKELTGMMWESNKETYQLQRVTDRLLKETDNLEKRITYTNQYSNRIIGGAR